MPWLPGAPLGGAFLVLPNLLDMLAAVWSMLMVAGAAAGLLMTWAL